MVFGLSPQSEVIVSVVSYSICSGSLVLVNKLILSFLPFPSIVMIVQILASLFLIYGANLCGVIEVDPIKWDHLKPYLLYTVAFSLGVYTNMMCLNSANVETVIVFRALSPICVSILDFLFLGRAFPSKRSMTALSLISLGAMGYAASDESFNTMGLAAYFWPIFYLIVITFEMVYGKKIVKDIKFATMSGPVQYTNLLGWVPMLAFAQFGGEFDRLGEMMNFYGVNSFGGLLMQLPPMSIALLIFGCITGTAIGYTGWWCRDKVSATSYTLIGVLNKCATVLVNLMIWDQHASPVGIASLFVCLVGGTFYQQAPYRKCDGDHTMKAQASKDLEASDDKPEIVVPLLKK